MKRTLFYGLIASMDLYYFYRMHTDLSPDTMHHLRFLTVWQLLAHAAFYGLSFAKGIKHLGGGEYQHAVHDSFTVFYYFLWSVTSLVGIVFWGLMLVDPQLIVPKHVIIPFDMNVWVHGVTAMTIWIELLFWSRPVPESFHNVLRAILGFSVTYLLWFYIQKFSVYGVYPYPIGETLQAHEMAVFIVVNLVLAVFFGWLGMAMMKLRWGVNDDNKRKQK